MTTDPQTQNYRLLFVPLVLLTLVSTVNTILSSVPQLLHFGFQFSLEILVLLLLLPAVLCLVALLQKNRPLLFYSLIEAEAGGVCPHCGAHWGGEQVIYR